MSKVKENEATLMKLESDKKHLEAEQLHVEIMTHGRLAAEHIVYLAQSLKKMRDKELYISFGIETFEEYCEQKAGIKQRHAYNYIRAIEELGPDYLKENARLGITKLVELSRLTDSDREELENTVDVDAVSTRELQEKVKELQKKCDQLTLENDELANEITNSEPTSNEPDKKALEKIKKDAEAKYKDKIKAEKFRADEAERILDAAREKSAALEKENRNLQASAKKEPPSSNKELLKYHFEEITRSFDAAVEIINNLEPEEREKFAAGFVTLIDKMKNNLTEE